MAPMTFVTKTHRSLCNLCRPAKCTCDEKTAALEAEATHWAKEGGHGLPSERDTGRLLGDSFVTSKQLATFVGRWKRAERMRDFQTWLAGRLEAVRFAAASYAVEVERLALYDEVLKLRFDGKGYELTEIAECLGLRAHSTVSTLLAEIEAEADHVQRRGAGVVAVPCRWCLRPITAWLGTGRPSRYCTTECTKLGREAGLGERRARRGRRKVPRPGAEGKGSSREAVGTTSAA